MSACWRNGNVEKCYRNVVNVAKTRHLKFALDIAERTIDNNADNNTGSCQSSA